MNSQVQVAATATETGRKWKPYTKAETRERNADMVAGVGKLPDDAHVSIAVLATLDNCHVATAWRRVKSGDLPKPIPVGGSTLFNLGEYRRMRGIKGPSA